VKFQTGVGENVPTVAGLRFASLSSQPVRNVFCEAVISSASATPVVPGATPLTTGSTPAASASPVAASPRRLTE
jgi:hypothetical protein